MLVVSRYKPAANALADELLRVCAVAEAVIEPVLVSAPLMVLLYR